MQKILLVTLAILMLAASPDLLSAEEGGGEGSVGSPTCPNAELFGSKLVTDVCWSCVFPIRIAGVDMSWGSHPNDAPKGAVSSSFCACDDDLGIPRPGVTMSMWEPARLIEIVRMPYCAPSLGGDRLKNSYRLMGGSKASDDERGTDKTFYQYHYYSFPLTQMLEMFNVAECQSSGYLDFDLMFMSELDPIWNDDELSFFTNPEVALFANPVALAACAADSAATSAGGEPIDSLFWCAGAWGSMYPFTGNITSQGSPPRDTSLLAARTVATLHRRGFAKETIGEDAMCHASYDPIITKSQYKMSMFYPVAESEKNHWIGAHTFTWGEWRNIPGVGEDFVYMLWQWNDCCLPF